MNLGAARLQSVMATLVLQVSDVADLMGVDQSVVSRWVRGERRPDPRMRARLEDLYGIGWRLWDTDSAPATGTGGA